MCKNKNGEIAHNVTSKVNNNNQNNQEEHT